MNAFVLYFILLKATISAFSGLTALPVIRDELVTKRHAVTDEQIATALVAGRVSPGPIGMFIVSIGYYAAGLPGAIAAWLALATPAIFIVPILRYIGARADRPIVHDALNAVILASVGLTLSALFPLVRSSVTGPVTAILAIGGGAFLLYRHGVTKPAAHTIQP